jgi:hypothetical protein
MIQKMSDQGKIQFTEKESEVKPVAAQEANNGITAKEALFRDQKAKTLDNAEVINSFRSANSVLSAGGGSIKDEGGPRKYIGSETQNSIWDTDIIEKLSGTKSNKEKTDDEKDNIKNARKNIRQESLDNLTEALSQTDTRKVADVSNMSEFNSVNYRKPLSNNLSIFDTEVFDNMPEKTAGEKMAEKARMAKEADTTWREFKGKEKSVISTLFDNLTKDKK